jgi:hypothetical protein
MKKKMLFYPVLLMLLFVACSKGTVEILTGDDYRYWKHKNSVTNPIPTYEYFDIKGRWTCFGFRDGRFKKVNTFDVVLNEHWHLEGDSILVFNYWKYNIVEISNERIILSRNGQTDTLLAVNDEEIPLKYKRRWNFSIHRPDILDRLYKYKIDSVYSANIKYLYNGLRKRGIIKKTDTLSIFIDDNSKRVSLPRIRKKINSLPIILQERLLDKSSTFIFRSPKMEYGLVSFHVIIPSKINVMDKDAVDICYEYELDDYFMHSSLLEELYW